MKNVGSRDRDARFILFIILVVAGILTEGFVRYAFWVISLVPAVTAFVGFCPLWAVLKINTTQKKA